eukprot:c53728_g1_i1.p1 GENE.c53728_g1_i1~~c53728_g1_i1.p1  ORF type:complete len:206 (+),score=37.21 c53728_g1_i1:26-619(+)
MATLPDSLFSDDMSYAVGPDGKRLTGNPTQEDYANALSAMRENKGPKRVCMNNLDDSTPMQMIEMLEACLTNTNVERLDLCHCNIDTLGGRLIGEVLKRNKTLIELNIETNGIGPKGMEAIAKGLADNTTLRVLRAENQSTPMGNRAERMFAAALEANRTVVKVAVAVAEVSSRTAINQSLMRNVERSRKRRLTGTE